MLSIAERHKYILESLHRQGYIKVADIAAELNVTAVTVRKDFKYLEDRGLLYRTHGSASPINPYVGDVSVSQKEKVNSSEKQRIGAAALELIDRNDSIIIASGSSICAFAEQISSEQGPLNVVTPSLKIALMLNALDNVTVIQLGGTVHKKSLSVRGNGFSTLSFDDFACSKLFIGVDGIDVDYGVTTSNLEEAHLTRMMMASSAKTIVLADSSKFTRRGFGRICPADQIDVIVTDDKVPAATVAAFEELGVEIIIAR